jgi:hypothetical protein
MMSLARPTDESLLEWRIARQRRRIAQVQTHIEGLLSSSPDLRGAKLLQDEMIRELARLLACRQPFFNRRLASEVLPRALRAVSRSTGSMRIASEGGT